MPRSRAICLLWLLPVAVLAAGCGSEPRSVAALRLEVDDLELPHRGFATLDLAWRVEEPLAGRVGQLRVFVHLLDGLGRVVRTFDHPWPGVWRPGGRAEYGVRLHQSALAPPLEPGVYGLSLGLYDEEGRRWPLTTGGEPVDRYEYRVAEVRVPAAVGGGPTFQFSSGWRDLEQGRDRQILARRWLGGAGHLRAAGLEGSGELWLQLRLPPPDGGQELVLAEGAAQQGAVVRCDCTDFEVRLSGPGSHDVILPFSPIAGDDSCGVEVTPNFYLLELESAERRAVALEILAWAPEPAG